MTLPLIDQLWALTCCGLVLLMQAGFLCTMARRHGQTPTGWPTNQRLVALTAVPVAFWGLGAATLFAAPFAELLGLAGPTTGRDAQLVFAVLQTLLCVAAVVVAMAFLPTYLLLRLARTGVLRSAEDGPLHEPAPSTAAPNAQTTADGFTDARVQRAEELRDYGLFLHAVLDGIEQSVCILDEYGQIVETNRSWDDFARESGRSAEGAIGASYTAFCRSGVYIGREINELASAAAQLAAGASDGFRAEHQALVGDQKRLLEVRLRPLPTHDRGAVIVLQRDLTEAREAEQRLRREKQKAETLADALEASQASLELVMKGGSFGLWHWDISTGYFELSIDWLEKIAGEGENFNSEIEAFRELLHPEERVFWTADDADSLAVDEPYDRQFRIRLPNGSYQWVQALGRSVGQQFSGAPQSLSGILIDIDARKRAELRDAGMAKIIEDSFNEIFVVDRQTLKFIEVNRGARKNLGYTLDELREMTPIDIKVPGTDSEFRNRIAELTADRDARLEFETLHQRRDGTTYPTMITVQQARLLERDVYVAICADLTQRKELESQLAEAQRLDSIGQLAAGIAHEMNTPLQFVGNNVQFLSECSEAVFKVYEEFSRQIDPQSAPRPWRERYQEIQEILDQTGFERIRHEAPVAIADSLVGIERVLEIVRAMKEFSHPGDSSPAPTDLNRAITSSATITRNRWKHAAELELDLDPHLPCVECQSGAINQVFVNLIVNAADAITERQEKEPELQQGQIVVRTRTSGDDAIIEVKDNGCGMPQEVIRRVFDPFFTTKEVGKGTGQGLSITHAIITQKHSGSISVESVAGEGTTFRVTLPFIHPADVAAVPVLPVEHVVV